MDIFGKKDIKDLGWDGLLNRTDAPSAYTPPSPTPSLVTESVTASSSQAEKVISGSFADILFANKINFSDTKQGYRMGIDPLDHTFKWLIGSSVAQVDFNVTGANTMTFTVTGNPGSSNAIRVLDASTSNWPAIDVRRTVGTGTGIYIQSDSPAGSSLDILNSSNTSAIHVISSGSGAFCQPLQLQTNNAISTNFYRMIDLRGGSAPVVNCKQWLANNTTPNGVLTGSKGDICQSSNGILYVNTDGATVWDALSKAYVPPPEYLATTDFSSSARINLTASANATATIGVTGLSLLTAGSGAGPYCSGQFAVFASTPALLYNGNPKVAFSFFLSEGVSKVDGSIFFGGLGVPTVSNAGVLMTDRHIGFKVIRESGVRNLYATQGNGGAETASSVLTTVASSDHFEFFIECLSGSSTNYYWRKNGSSWSNATNLVGCLPAWNSAESPYLEFGASPAATGDDTGYSITAASYRR